MEALLKILSVLASRSQHPALDTTQIALLDVSYVTLNNFPHSLPLSFTDGHHFIMLLWVLLSKQFFTFLLVLGHLSLISRHTFFISLYQSSWLQLVALKIAVHMTVSDAGAGWWIYWHRFAHEVDRVTQGLQSQELQQPAGMGWQTLWSKGWCESGIRSSILVQLWARG